MKKSIFLLVAFSFLLIVSPLGSAIERDPNSITSTFFQTLQKGNVEKAYDLLWKGSEIISEKKQMISMIKSQTKTALDLYGVIIGYEKVMEEEFGTSIVRFVYVLKQERHPTVWEFYLYKPKTEWTVSQVKFDDQFQALIRKK